MRLALLIGLGVLAGTLPAIAHDTSDEQRLPVIGPAPAIELVSQDGREMTLKALRGKVVAVTFIYTHCPDICPMLTAQMARIQNSLADNFGKDIAFLSITTDPLRDTPEVLREYAKAFGAKLSGWTFLTGDPAKIDDIARQYGVFAAKKPDGQVDHTLLTTLVDRRGMMRVQYIGYRFDPDELLRDIIALIAER